MKKIILMLMLLAPMAMMAQKFGKVNTQTIMQSMPEVSKANGELEAQQKQYANDLQAMQNELQRKAEGNRNRVAEYVQQDSADLSGQSEGFAGQEQ